MKNKPKTIVTDSENVFVIMRFDTPATLITKMEWSLKAKRVYRAKEESLKEIERLNKLNVSKGAIYFFKSAKLPKHKGAESSTPSNWRPPPPKYEHVFPIVGYEANYKRRILMRGKFTIRKIMRVFEEAEAEAKRLNRIKGKYKYFTSCAQLLK